MKQSVKKQNEMLIKDKIPFEWNSKLVSNRHIADEIHCFESTTPTMNQ